MSELVVTRTPEMIAAEINGIKNHAKTILLVSSVEIGQRLVEAKAQLQHGEWMNWLRESVDYSQSTANNLMKLYEEYGDKITTIGNLDFGKLPYTKALALIGIPEEEREAFVAENDVESMSARELQQAVQEKKEAEKRAKEAEKAAEKERKAREKLEKESKNQAAEVARLLKELEQAKATGNEEELQRLRDEVETKRNELALSLAKQKELEQELKEKPIETSAVVEKIPEEVERELAELRHKVAKIESNPAATKFKLSFDALVVGFRDLLGALNEMGPEDQEKYKKAVNGLIGKMSERLK